MLFATIYAIITSLFWTGKEVPGLRRLGKLTLHLPIRRTDYRPPRLQPPRLQPFALVPLALAALSAGELSVRQAWGLSYANKFRPRGT